MSGGTLKYMLQKSSIQLNELLNATCKFLDNMCTYLLVNQKFWGWETCCTITIMDVDYTDDIPLLANSSAQAESLLHSLEWAAGGIGLHVNSDKTEYMFFHQRGDISTLNGGPLKLEDKFTYLGSSVSSTENGINKWLAKAWTAIDRLSVLWKTDLTDKIECSFFDTAIWMHHMDSN